MFLFSQPFANEKKTADCNFAHLSHGKETADCSLAHLSHGKIPLWRKAGKIRKLRKEDFEYVGL